MTDPETDVTILLERWRQGDERALDELLPIVFEEVRALARRLFVDEPASHTLQPTALVSEVYLKLTDLKPPRCASRDELIGFLARVMRHILVDYARRRRSRRRGGGQSKIAIDGEVRAISDPTGLTPEQREELLDVDRALARLEAEDPRLARVVELRYFLGLTAKETVEKLDVSRDTAWRDLKKAKEWLKAQLGHQRIGRG